MKIKEKKLEITVLDLSEAPKVYADFDIIISLLDEHLLHRITHQGENHLILSFEDDEYVNPYGPQPEHIEKIIMHVANCLVHHQKEENVKVLVHCHAGISRSTATAIMLEMFWNKLTAKEAFDKVEKNRPMLWPNSLLLRYFDSILDKFDAEPYCLEWKKAKSEALKAEGKFFIGY